MVVMCKCQKWWRDGLTILMMGHVPDGIDVWLVGHVSVLMCHVSDSIDGLCFGQY